MQIQVHQTLVHLGAWLEVEWVEVTGFRPFNSRGAECGEDRANATLSHFLSTLHHSLL